ncbi:MAG TPA: hypothetical protein VGB18_01495 [Candidatus Thermoplasmatota archaeon]
MEAYPAYKRAEESTYLTLPEWYEVFSYQEYGDHIGRERPSVFPHYEAIGQFWSVYCHAYGESAGYPFNGGNHLVIGVIGVSFTVEYLVKGTYESTYGALTEFDSRTTSEDAYAAVTAQDFAHFVETEPWYAYPFGDRALGVWTENGLFGPDMVRKTERKVVLTSEYAVKAVYAGLIRAATQSVFGAPPAEDYLWVDNATVELLARPDVRIAEQVNDTSFVIMVPHYQRFTELVPELARDGVGFVDIAGNERIALTVLAPRGSAYPDSLAEEFLRHEALTNPSMERIFLLCPIAELDELVLELDRRGHRIEHLFDY